MDEDDQRSAGITDWKEIQRLALARSIAEVILRRNGTPRRSRRLSPACKIFLMGRDGCPVVVEPVERRAIHERRGGLFESHRDDLVGLRSARRADFDAVALGLADQR